MTTVNDRFGFGLDITGADEVEIQIDHKGQTIWVNTIYGLKLRICRIKHLTLVDERTTKCP